VRRRVATPQCYSGGRHAECPASSVAHVSPPHFPRRKGLSAWTTALHPDGVSGRGRDLESMTPTASNAYPCPTHLTTRARSLWKPLPRLAKYQSGSPLLCSWRNHAVPGIFSNPAPGDAIHTAFMNNAGKGHQEFGRLHTSIYIAARSAAIRPLRFFTSARVHAKLSQECGLFQTCGML
jgi:hypothetical protein